MARLLLIRHGQSLWNAESRWQGWADPALSEQGEAEAAVLASRLAPAGFQVVVCSDLERARRTASVVSRRLGVAPEEDTALRERDVGAWQGLTTAEIERAWPEELAAWRSGALSTPPRGEPDHMMATRVLGALQRLAARPESAALVVTHGGVIRLVERRLGLEPLSTPNLSGRWLHRGGDGQGFEAFVLGPAFLASDLDAGAGGAFVASTPVPQATEGS